MELDLQAYRPGTTAEPGDPVTEYEEDDPEQLVMFVNSNEDPDTYEREFLDDKIGPKDKDIVKLVLKRVPIENIQHGRIEFILRPKALFKVYDRDLQPVAVDGPLDLSSSETPNLDIFNGDIVLYLESVGPVYSAVAAVRSVVNEAVVSYDKVKFTSILHLADFHDDVVLFANIAANSTCGNSLTRWAFPIEQTFEPEFRAPWMKSSKTSTRAI